MRDSQIDIVIVLSGHNLTPPGVAAFAWKEAAEHFEVAETDLPVEKMTVTFDEYLGQTRATVEFLLTW